MTLRANARLAGLTLLLYFVTGLGVVASILGLVELTLEMLGFLHGPVALVPWIPMALFELILALWLLIKGVAVRSAPAPYPTPSGILAE